jgi:3-hydroxy acid dehydrogenase/malonic semialdehyde reductase
MSKITLITGATSGIGRACAEKFASLGHDLIITGRRMERLKELETSLVEQFGVKVLSLNFDVRNQPAVDSAIKGLDLKWREIDILINNAGLALGLNTIDDGLLEDWEQMIDTNIKGLLYVSKAVIALMKEQKYGHIINIGSIAGREVYAKGNVYCATKYAVNALTKGMRIDLLPFGIKVTEVSPGAANTEFSKVRFHGDEVVANKVYDGFEPLTGYDVANVVAFVASLPPHVNINDIVVVPTAQASASIIRKA